MVGELGDTALLYIDNIEITLPSGVVGSTGFGGLAVIVAGKMDGFAKIPLYESLARKISENCERVVFDTVTIGYFFRTGLVGADSFGKLGEKISGHTECLGSSSDINDPNTLLSAFARDYALRVHLQRFKLDSNGSGSYKVMSKPEQVSVLEKLARDVRFGSRGDAGRALETSERVFQGSPYDEQLDRLFELAHGGDEREYELSKDLFLALIMENYTRAKELNAQLN